MPSTVLSPGVSQSACPFTEHARIAALRRYDLLDTPPEPQFDRIVHLAGQMLGAPISLMSLVDASRQWFKARLGLDVAETERTAGFCHHTIQSDDVMVVEDASADPRFADNPMVVGNPQVRFYAGAPLVTGEGFRLGTLCVVDTQPRSVSPAQQSTLRELADLAIDTMEMRRANLELLRLATTDPMTGAGNRRTFFRQAERELERVRRFDMPLAVMMVDLDRFKQINDTMGHAAGDIVLVHTARLIAGALRTGDVFARMGGEEFAAPLPHTDANGARIVAERVREQIEAASIPVSKTRINVTASIGLSEVRPADMTIEDALSRADEAMYRGKEAGRNCVVAG